MVARAAASHPRAARADVVFSACRCGGDELDAAAAGGAAPGLGLPALRAGEESGVVVVRAYITETMTLILNQWSLM